MATKPIFVPRTGYPTTVSGSGNQRKADWSSKPSDTFKHFSNIDALTSDLVTKNYSNLPVTWRGAIGSVTSAYPFGPDGGEFTADCKNTYYGTMRIGPKTESLSNNITGQVPVHNVQGVNFMWDRNNCYWSVCAIALKYIGLRIWDPDLGKECVERMSLKKYTGYMMDSKDPWGEKTDASELNVWQLDTNSENYWKGRPKALWIGLYVEFWMPSHKTASHKRTFRIRYLNPVYRAESTSGLKYIPPSGVWSTGTGRYPIAGGAGVP